MAEFSPVGAKHAKILCGFCGLNFIVLIEKLRGGTEPDCPRCLDDFAKAALTGFLSAAICPDRELMIERTTEDCYRIAVSMRNERKKYFS